MSAERAGVTILIQHNWWAKKLLPGKIVAYKTLQNICILTDPGSFGNHPFYNLWLNSRIWSVVEEGRWSEV